MPLSSSESIRGADLISYYNENVSGFNDILLLSLFPSHSSFNMC